MLKKLNHIFCLFTRREKLYLLFILFVMLATAALEAIGIGLIIPFLDLVSNPENIKLNNYLSTAWSYFEFEKTQMITSFALFFFIIYVVKNIFFLWTYYLQRNFLTQKRLELHSFVYFYYLKSPYEFHLNQNSAILMRNIDEIGGAFQNFIQPLLVLITEFILILSVVITLFIIRPQITLYSFLFLAISLGIFNLVTVRAYRRLGKEKVDFSGEVNRYFFEGLHGIKEIKILTKEEFFIKKYMSAIKNFLYTAKDIDILNQATRPYYEIVVIGLITFLVILNINTGNDKNLVASLALFGIALMRLLPSFNKISINLNSINTNQESLDLIISEFERLGVLELIKNGATKKILTTKDESTKFKFNHVIELNKINFKYQSSTSLILENLDLKIKKGDFIGIIGESGAGKSTLVNLLVGLLNPTSGSILVDGKTINLNDQKKNSIGYVPQSIFLIDGPIKNNIAFGILEENIDPIRLKMAIQESQLDQFVNKTDQGIEMIVGERGVKLSGGQLQRIGIARALYHDPEVIILDEATSALDPQTEKGFLDMLNNLVHKKTIIFITHKPAALRHCDFIYKLKDGQLYPISLG